MKTYPVTIELTVWIELGINQYEVTIDENSSISLKCTDDVLRTRELTPSEVNILIEAIQMVEMPVLRYANRNSIKTSVSYELIIESAHFSAEFNWEDADIAIDTLESLDSVSRLAELVERFGQFH